MTTKRSVTLLAGCSGRAYGTEKDPPNLIRLIPA